MSASLPTGTLSQGAVRLEDSNRARLLYDRSSYGTKNDDRTIDLSLIEATHLISIGKLRVLDGRGNELDSEAFAKRASRSDKRFRIKAAAYSALRGKGYILKTALKYGADFRVYDKGVSVGEDHSRWLLFVTSEKDRMTMTEYVARNRVAHSTRKQLLIAIVDSEHSVTFYENKWVRP